MPWKYSIIRTGSLGDYLSGEIKEKFNTKRSDTLGYPQRCFLGSPETDQKSIRLVYLLQNIQIRTILHFQLAF